MVSVLPVFLILVIPVQRRMETPTWVLQIQDVEAMGTILLPMSWEHGQALVRVEIQERKRAKIIGTVSLSTSY
jgi:hypothetical protein